METIQYQTHGTCCRMILAQVDNGVVKDVQFAGGCMGNQAGIRALTSCPDQLARALQSYLDK